jgi:MSHA biogenesis protein MshL
MSFESRGLRIRVAPWLAIAGAACASAPAVAPPQTHVRLEPPPASATQTAAPLPTLPPITATGGLADAKGPRVQLLRADDQEFSTVVRQLANTFGYQYQIDPSIKGKVNATLRNATLYEALDAIMPQGAAYEIKGGVLRIGPARMETRIFTLDYVALSRFGTASTVIQRRLGTGVGGNNGGGTGSGGITGNAGGQSGQGGFGGGGGGGADVISATSVADAWEEIRVAVDALTFDAPGGTGSEGASGGGSLSGGRPYSRTSPDGRRVIISAMSGTITVTSMPNRLDQIEHFIKTFEASVQRQVLIEAKIVEVNLDRTFEFGIDWNIVAGGGTTKLSPGGGRGGSNVEFTLNGGGAQISAVLTALSSQGDVKVLSSPRVSALNNQRAVFDVTTGEIVFNVTRTPITDAQGRTTFSTTVNPTQVNVGIVLDVLPQIGADNTVTMNIRPVVTSVARTASFTNADGTLSQVPVIDTRESDTMARLRAGETIIIGGLMQNRQEKVKSGVPVLRSIPLLGRLFTRTINVEHKAELVIFLTPTIIAGHPPAGR